MRKIKSNIQRIHNEMNGIINGNFSAAQIFIPSFRDGNNTVLEMTRVRESEWCACVRLMWQIKFYRIDIRDLN